MRHAALWLRRADGMEGEVEVVCHATMRDGRERGRRALTVCNLRRGVCLQFFCHIVNVANGTGRGHERYSMSASSSAFDGVIRTAYSS